MSGKDKPTTKTVSSDDNHNLNVEILSNGLSTSRVKIIPGENRSTENESDSKNEISP